MWTPVYLFREARRWAGPRDPGFPVILGDRLALTFRVYMQLVSETCHLQSLFEFNLMTQAVLLEWKDLWEDCDVALSFDSLSDMSRVYSVCG